MRYVNDAGQPASPRRRRLMITGAGAVLAAMLGTAPARPRQSFDAALLAEAVRRAGRFETLRTLIVARHGEVAAEETFNGGRLDAPTNVKSVAKTILSALVGIAVDRGMLDGADQPIAPILSDRLPDGADPRLSEITVGHLLSMQAGLERTSGPNYGAWVQSGDWVRHALSRPFVDEPGGDMIYSTGSSHLLSAVLTAVSGRSTLELARDWLGEPLGIDIPPWERDPQGIYLGGNNMALSPRALLAFGEMYRKGGVAPDGARVTSERWIAESWRVRTRSRWTGHGYGYGWFTARARGRPVHYGWGYGGQMLHVVPFADMTVVITSRPDVPSGRTGYARRLHELVADGFVAAALAADRA